METNGSALAVVEPNSMEANVGVLMRRATDVAGVCRDIVMKTAQSIGGRKYVRVEGWQSIAVAYGCVASARDVEMVAGGVRAIGEIRRMSDGAVLATAEGFVGDDEKTWAARPMYARRAMAQTRAISRACRSAFAFVVTVIDSSLSTTPAEEMDGLNPETPPPPTGAAGLKERMRPTPPPATEFRPDPDGGPVFPNYGRSKGLPVRGATKQDLDFYLSGAKKQLADPAKSQYHEANAKLAAAIEAELARQ